MRIMARLLYMEHGLAKTPDGFPATSRTMRPSTLNPGLQGLLEWWTVCCSRWVCSPARCLFSSRTIRAVAYFMVHAPRDVFPLLNAGSWRSSTRSSSSISGSPGAANGALIEYASPHPHPPYRQARPEPSGAPATQRCRQFPRRCWRRAARSSSDARSWRSALDPEPARIVVRGS
jgi:hypothetical protein